MMYSSQYLDTEEQNMSDFTSRSVLKRKEAQTSTYHWMIDKAYGACGNQTLPVHGPHDCDADEAFGPQAERVLLLDDDGVICYGGLIQGTDYEGAEPLDDFGTLHMAKTINTPALPYTNGFGYWFIMGKKARLSACVDKKNEV
jgi:hypothetical protein